MDEIKKKENNGEPLEWEFQLISKDPESKKFIQELLFQRSNLEASAKQIENSDEYLKDIRDITKCTHI